MHSCICRLHAMQVSYYLFGAQSLQPIGCIACMYCKLPDGLGLSDLLCPDAHCCLCVLLTEKELLRQCAKCRLCSCIRCGERVQCVISYAHTRYSDWAYAGTHANCIQSIVHDCVHVIFDQSAVRRSFVAAVLACLDFCSWLHS